MGHFPWLCKITRGCIYIYPLVMTNMSRWKIDGPNRNRWFTVLNSMVDLSMAMLNNQRVYNIYIYV